MTARAAGHYAGYALHSEVSLPALQESQQISTGHPIRISRVQRSPPQDKTVWTWRHEWHEPDGSVSLQLAALEHASDGSVARYWLRSPGQCDFILDPSHGSIEVEAKESCAATTLEHLLLDQALPRLLAGRGQLVVHASIVRLERGAVAFVGRSGMGKSTLAAMFHRHGFFALCDDCALLEVQDEQVVAIPSYPGLRLYSDSIAHAWKYSTTRRPVADYTDKQRVIDPSLPRDACAAQPLAGICLLDQPDSGDTTTTIRPMSASAACMAIIEQSFRLDPTDHQQTVHQLGLVSGVAQASPTFLLSYPRDFTQQDALVARLLEHFDVDSQNHT